LGQKAVKIVAAVPLTQLLKAEWRLE